VINLAKDGTFPSSGEGKEQVLPDLVSVYAIVKLRVKRIPELDNNFRGFRAYWSEELHKALQIVGEVKVVNVVT
jgi:hypothetical protein